MIVISAEGIVTEREYFNMFNSETTVLHVKIGRKSPERHYRLVKELLEH